MFLRLNLIGDKVVSLVPDCDLLGCRVRCGLFNAHAERASRCCRRWEVGARSNELYGHNLGEADAIGPCALLLLPCGPEAHAANAAVLEMGGVRVSRVGLESCGRQRRTRSRIGHWTTARVGFSLYCTIGPVLLFPMKLSYSL